MATPKNPTEAPKGTEVVSNNTLMVDNTDVTEVVEVKVETESYELVDGLIQVNYK